MTSGEQGFGGVVAGAQSTSPLASGAAWRPVGGPPAQRTPEEPVSASIVEPTGDLVVDAAVQAVASAAGASPAEQLPHYEAAHQALRDALSRIDDH